MNKSQLYPVFEAMGFMFEDCVWKNFTMPDGAIYIHYHESEFEFEFEVDDEYEFIRKHESEFESVGQILEFCFEKYGEMKFNQGDYTRLAEIKKSLRM